MLPATWKRKQRGLLGTPWALLLELLDAFDVLKSTHMVGQPPSFPVLAYSRSGRNGRRTETTEAISRRAEGRKAAGRRAAGRRAAGRRIAGRRTAKTEKVTRSARIV